MRRLSPIIVLFLAGCGATARTGTGPTPTDHDLDYPVGPFSLTERSGRTVTDRDLRGSVWVASFIFTRCTGPCPQVSSTVARLQAELKDEPGVKFVTFTVDPSRDDLAALREYAKIRGADAERWLFLTGDEATIHKLMHTQFKQGVERNEQPGAKPGDEFNHSTRLVLVDKNGVIRAMFDGLPNEQFPDQFDANYARLIRRARELARE